MTIDEDDRTVISAAFDAAQQRTSAQLQAVLAETSSDYALGPLVASFLIALAAPWPLILFTILPTQSIFTAQLAVSLVLLALFSLPKLRMALTPARARRAIAHRAALTQFVIRGGERAAGRNAVLIYVSLAERYARVIAGEEACRHISQAEWQKLVDALTANIAENGARAALVGAAVSAADLLAPHFPGQSGGASRLAHFHLV